MGKRSNASAVKKEQRPFPEGEEMASACRLRGVEKRGRRKQGEKRNQRRRSLVFHVACNYKTSPRNKSSHYF